MKFCIDNHWPEIKRIILRRIIEERPYDEIADKIIDDIQGFIRGCKIPDKNWK